MSFEATRLLSVVAFLLLVLAAFVVLRSRPARGGLDKLGGRILGRAPRPEPAESISEPRAARRLTLPELVLSPRTPLVVLKKPSPTRHPIVLAHGYLGFASVGLPRSRREYFLGVRDRLESLGYRVYVARLSPTASISVRAIQLARQVESLGADRVNIIAHSMGGLDARYAITHLGLRARVASLTTIGTPHRGTPIADGGALLIGEWRNVRRMLSRVGANVDGLYDMTTSRMEEFNRVVIDAAEVMYASVLSAVPPLGRPVNPLLFPAYSYLQRTAGPNDGMVPVESQKWGEIVGEIQADHWEQIGWSRSFDARRFYAVLAEHLAEWGL